MFTAVMIFQLMEEKKLSLETTLSKYFPEVPNAKKITIAQLLNHHSGIHDFTRDSTYETYMEKPQTHKEMLEHITNGKPAFEPGAKAEYSNSNYVLLGYIIEKISGKPYADVLQERIVQKLKLKNTYYGGKIDPEKNESFSYVKNSDWVKQPETDMSIPNGAGGIVSSPSDLDLFITALFNKQLVTEKELNTMMTLQDKYGMGMFSFPFGNKTAYGHTGQIDAFGTMLAYFPDEKLAIAYCSNGEITPLNDMMIGVLSIYFNQPYKIPTYHSVELTSADLDQYLGVYASKEIPLKITITKENVTLMAQGTGQPAFPLEATDKHTFGFEPAGVIMKFDPAQKKFVLEQGGGKYTFVKE
jgi:CubicO group peptidase (beta-lactamase class C family)